MSGFSVIDLLLLPIGLGLLGFVEPCSVAASLVFVKYLEAGDAAAKLSQVLVFAVTRALFIGLLGVAAALFGSAFLGFQRAAWTALGAIYVVLGAAYLLGRAGALRRRLGPHLPRVSGQRGPVALGLLFGLNIPACATPLLFALFGTAAAGSAAGRPIAQGFLSLALFGTALSLPLVLAALFAPARRALDRLAGLTRRLPLPTGLVLIALGLWSIGFALFFSPQSWA